jgi:hypothetical protein
MRILQKDGQKEQCFKFVNAILPAKRVLEDADHD